MKKSLALALSASVTALLSVDAASAQGFEWEGEIEIANEQVMSSDVAANEIRDTYAVISLGGSYTFGNGVGIFSTLTAESLTAPTADRTFDDMGLYIEELGLSFGIGANTTVAAGKLHPVFGSAWDDTAGFFAGIQAEDYELIEQIGVMADVEFGGAGTLSAALFFADDTGLSRSAGFDRGRNTTAAGGAGNTGKLDNIAIQWSGQVGETSYHIAARHLSAGIGDVDDERGVLIGASHEFDNGLYLFGELASFQNFGGSADDATYATLNAAYGIGNWTLSGAFTSADLDTQGKTDTTSIAAEYEFENGILLGGALALRDTAGVEDRVLGVNMIIPLGG